MDDLKQTLEDAIVRVNLIQTMRNQATEAITQLGVEVIQLNDGAWVAMFGDVMVENNSIELALMGLVDKLSFKYLEAQMDEEDGN